MPEDDLEKRIRELELAMPDDLDRRLRLLEVNTALLPEMQRQLTALQNTLNVFANEGQDRGEHVQAVLQRLVMLESEHAKCF